MSREPPATPPAPGRDLQGFRAEVDPALEKAGKA